MYRFIRQGVLVSAVSLAAASTAFAASQTANLAVSASVTDNCTITTAAIPFGSYDPIVANDTAPLDNTGTVTITCTKGTPATIGLGTGLNAGKVVGVSRAMNDTASPTPDYLGYELYQDSGHATVWTNSGAGLLSPAAAPSKAARNFSVYGRVIAGQDVPQNSYTDTVVATVNF
ncbi:MAG: spore coat U domain-containing protein [Candidatus Binatia bacterium]